MALFNGSEFGEFLTGGAGDDVINGFGGSDQLTGGDGSDTLDGGDGFDFARFDERSLAFIFTFGPGAAATAVASDDSETDTLLNIETVHGTDFGDTVNVLAGFTGTDGAFAQYVSGAGNDVITVDPSMSVRVSYSDATGSVSVNLGTGVASAAGEGVDTLVNVTDVIGSNFGDVLIGSDNLDPGAFGRESFRTLNGSDHIDGRGGVDRLDYRFAEAVVVDMSAGTTVKANNAGVDTFLNIENVRGSFNSDTIDGDDEANLLEGRNGGDILRGNGGDDDLRGEQDDDQLFGGLGVDLLNGGSGTDALDGGDGDDWLDMRSESAGVRVDFSAGTVDDSFGSTDTITSIEGVFGSSFDDTFVGDGAGRSYEGGDGADMFDYSAATSAVTANLAAGRITVDGVDDDVVGIEGVTGGASNDVLIGDDGANTLRGLAGADRFVGRGGDDEMAGGLGNDIYAVDDVGDVVIEAANEGNDRINTTVDYTNAANVEFLVGKFASVGLQLTGHGATDRITGANKINSGDVISGEGGNDKLIGLVGDDVLNGGLGNDRIFGNSGDDVIAGGVGNDRVTGQQGADRFVHAPGDGKDRITDFDVDGDLLDVTAHDFASFAAVQAALSDVADGALLALGGGDSVLLVGVAAASIGAEDVLIATV